MVLYEFVSKEAVVDLPYAYSELSNYFWRTAGYLHSRKSKFEIGSLMGSDA